MVNDWDKTSDDVYFVADTLGSIDLVERAHILLIYDVKGYLDSLNFVEGLEEKWLFHPIVKLQPI